MNQHTQQPFPSNFPYKTGPSNLRFSSQSANPPFSVQKMLQNNQQLQDRLNEERSKNFDLLELKRRLQEQISRLEFELDRIGNYQNLTNKEVAIKNNQLALDNQKLKNQLDQYFQENKQVRADLRKLRDEFQRVSKEKEDLVGQNVMLLNHIVHLKQKGVGSYQQHRIQQHPESFFQNRIQQHPESFSQNRVQSSQPQYQQHIIQSPQNRINKQQRSTNRTDIRSPILNTNTNTNGKQIPSISKIHQQFYDQNAEPSPRSFTNNKIQQKLQSETNLPTSFYSSPNHQIPSIPSLQTIQNSNNVPQKTNSRQSLTLNLIENNPQRQTVNTSDRHKGILKTKVAELRDEILSQISKNHYKRSLQIAERDQTNSLKVFMTLLEPDLPTFTQMTLNYLQARECTLESCPTLRKKWVPEEHANKNNKWVAQIYESIKQNSKKQRSIAGQYLALFRSLTLLSKLEGDIDMLLIDNIKHSALKYIYKKSVCFNK